MSDPSKNFGDAAVNYSAHRPAYPAALFDFLLEHATSGRGHAADLGAGSGQATRTLAAHFARVTAVEPDARLANAVRFPDNVEIQIAAAEDARFDDGSLDAVVSATAFHWMDQKAICASAARWLRRGGAFFPFAYDVFRIEGPGEAFYAEEFEKWRSFRDARLESGYDYAGAIEKSACFPSVILYRDEMRRSFPAKDAAGLIATISYARAYADEHEGRDAYFARMRDHLADFGDAISFVFPLVGALAVKR